MAKLNPSDPQFGIPIAARIKGDLALRLNQEAIASGKTFSRYVAEYIEKTAAFEKKLGEITMLLTKEKETVALKEKQIRELEALLAKERDVCKKTAGRFILEISNGNQKQATQLITNYNSILKDEKSK